MRIIRNNESSMDPKLSRTLHLPTGLSITHAIAGGAGAPPAWWREDQNWRTKSIEAMKAPLSFPLLNGLELFSEES